MNTEFDYSGLNNKSIIDIFDGDLSLGEYEFENGRKTLIKLPYLNTDTIKNMLAYFGVDPRLIAVNKSRSKYMEDLISHCIQNKQCDELLNYIIDKDKINNCFTYQPYEERKIATEETVLKVLNKINEILLMKQIEIVEIDEKYLIRKTGEKEEMKEFEIKKLKRNEVILTAFNEYALIKQVGQGGNGVVWQASDKDGEKVALKFVRRNSSSSFLKRFKNETFFCIRNKHENIIQIKDYGTVNDEYIFYVMPLYSETLRSKMKKGISSEEALDIFVGILNGLNYAHSNNVIHRDIKPENILFAEDSNVPIIADFGIAHFSKDMLETVIETKAGDRMANFQYAAPEQRIRGKEAVAQSDIYSAALILNEMFTNEIPQAGGYKTIASVDENFGFLDEVFNQINIQDPADRLYPEDKILTEINAQYEIFKRNNRNKELEQIKIVEQKTPTYNPSIKTIKYEKGAIVFELDTKIEKEWFDILHYGHYSHTCVLGKDTDSLQIEADNKIKMPIKDYNSNDEIVRIVGYVKEWLQQSRGLYNEIIKQEQEEFKREQERKRIREIEENKREMSINQMLSDLL